MKAKQRPIRRKWRTLLSVLLVLVAAPVSLFGVLVGFCTIPTALSLSHNLTQAAIHNVYSEAELVQRIQDEVRQKLAWHGPATLGYVFFEDTCQAGTCALEELSLEILIDHFRICVGGRKIHHTSVEVDIDFKTSQVEVELHPGQMWSSKAVTTELWSVIPRLKDKALNSLEDEIQILHPTLVLKVILDVDSWCLIVSTPDGEVIHQEKGSY